jgi:hypothetical protein
MFDGYEWNDNTDARLDLSSMKPLSFTSSRATPLQCTFRARPHLYNSTTYNKTKDEGKNSKGHQTSRG